MTELRAFLVALTFGLAVEVGIYYGLEALGADGGLAASLEVIWLCVFVFLGVLFVGRYEHDYEHEGGDDAGD
jgi:hypothetical protein